MGYSARIYSVQFAIPREKQHEALRAIKAMFAPEVMRQHTTSYTAFGGQEIERRYAWVTTADALAAPTLDAMLQEWGWGGKYDADSNLIGISFDAEKLGDEDVLWQALAPFVDAGSHIEMVGEEGERWRWYFDGATVTEQRATANYG